MMYRNIFVTGTNSCTGSESNEQLAIHLLIKQGYKIVETLDDAHIVLFFGCVYTTGRINKCAQELNLILDEKKSDTLVIITGCFSGKTDVVDYYKEKVDYIIKEYGLNGVVSTIKVVEELNNKQYCVNSKSLISSSPNEYCYINIVDGCENRCTFCKNNYMDTHLCSSMMENIVFFVKEQVKAGIRCVTLSGLNITQYGIDIYGKQMLHELLTQLSQIEDLKWIRLYMLAPQDMYEDLTKEIINNKKVVSMIIPIQTCSDRLLKLMNRKHTNEECYNILSEIRIARPDIFMETALMESFPTETEEDIRETAKQIRKYGFDEIIVSPYSNNSDLPSSKLKQLSKEQKLKNSALYSQLFMREVSRKQDSLKGQTIHCIVIEQKQDIALCITNRILCSGDLWVFVKVPKGVMLEENSLISSKITKLPKRNKKVQFNFRTETTLKAKFCDYIL